MTTLAVAASLYFVASRLAYTVGVGAMLTRQRHDQAFTRRHGAEAGYRRFRRYAALLMNHDGAAFVALALVTMGTLDLPWVSRAVQVGIGTALCMVGVGAKLWAVSTLGDAGYHWKDFFGPHIEHELVRTGPYRWFRNPMYTVGYAQTYGLALIVGSGPALAASLFAQAAILAFNHIVERPHVEWIETGQHEIPRRPRATEPARRSTR